MVGFKESKCNWLKDLPTLSRNPGGETTAPAGSGHTDIAIFKAVRIILFQNQLISFNRLSSFETQVMTVLELFNLASSFVKLMGSLVA